MTAPVLTSLALENAEVLRVLAADVRPASVSEIARQIGRDRSNLGKALQALEKAGIVHKSDGAVVPELTDAGHAALAAIDRALGEGGGALPSAPYARFKANPFNPRKRFDRESLEALADTIVADGQVNVPAIVFPPDADGSLTLYDGERRWRALGILIERGVDPEDYPLSYVVREGDPAQAEAETIRLALIVNAQREDVDLLEDADALARLLELNGWSARHAAQQLGRNERVVQEAVKVSREISPEDRAAWRSGQPDEITSFEDLRRKVRAPKPADPDQLDLVDQVGEPKRPPLEGLARLALLELTHAVQVSALEPDDGSAPFALAGGSTYLEETYRTLRDRGLLEQRLTHVAGKYTEGVLLTPEGERLSAELFGARPILLVMLMGEQAKLPRPHVPAGLDERLYHTPWLNDAIDRSAIKRSREIRANPSPLQILRLTEIAHAAQRGWAAKQLGGNYALYGDPNAKNGDDAARDLACAYLVETHGDRGFVGIRPSAAGWALLAREGISYEVTPGERAVSDEGLEEARSRVDRLDEARRAELRETGTYATGWLNGPHPDKDPLVYAGVRYGNATRAGEARRAREGQKISVAPPSRKAEPPAADAPLASFAEQVRMAGEAGEDADEAALERELSKGRLAHAISLHNQLAANWSPDNASNVAGFQGQLNMLLETLTEAGAPFSSNPEDEDHQTLGNVYDANDTYVLTVDTGGETSDDDARALAVLVAAALNVLAGHPIAPLQLPEAA